MRIRVRCNACAALVQVGRTTARLLRRDDEEGAGRLALVFRCPSCRCRSESAVHPATERALVEAGLRVEDDLAAGRGHLRSARPSAPALDVDDLLDFVVALHREPSAVFADLDRLTADAPAGRDRDRP